MRATTIKPAGLRVLVAALLVLVVLGTLAPVALAALTISGTLETPTTLTAQTRYILYYLQLHAGPSEQRFAVRMTPPPFATAGGLPEGMSLDGPTDIALQGPGTLGQQVDKPSAIAPCSNRPAAFHGYAAGIAAVDVLLPANANTVLAVRYDTGRRAPWVDSDFRLRFTIEPFLVGRYPSSSPFAAGTTVTSPLAVTTTGPLVSGPTGAHILLTTSPHASSRQPYAAKRISSGAKVAISGRLLPGDAGRRIVLEWSRGGGRLHALATVTTGAGGGFGTTRWRPPAAKGTYELWARYPSQPGGLLADGTSCPLRFAVP